MESPEAAEQDAKRYFEAPDITLRVTDRCNLECIHCFAGSAKESGDTELSLHEIKGIIDWASGRGSFRLGITGGEPTLRKDLVEIVRYAKDSNLWTMVTTNGYSLTDDLCSALHSAGIDQVDVSLDNSTAALHDHFRGRTGSFERAVKAVSTLMSHNIVTAVTSVVSTWNVEDLSALYQLARESGAAIFKVDAFIAVGRGQQELALSPEQFKNVYEWMDTLDDPDITAEKFSDKFDFLYAAPSLNVLEAVFDYKGAPVCEAAITRCTITAEGVVLPCSYFCTPEFYAGNIREQPLDEIWDESEVFKTFRTIHPFEGACTSCEYNTVCRGGCRARAYYMGEHPLGPDPYCWLATKKER